MSCIRSNSTNEAKDGACCWKRDGDEIETHFSDGIIILKSLEDEERVDKFHIHRHCIATGTCRIKNVSLKQKNKECQIFLHTNGMISAFPFILDYLYSEGSTLFSIYRLPKPREDIIAILALARYLGLVRLVERLQTYIQKKCFGVKGAGLSDDKQAEANIATFWLSEATKYGEEKAIETILMLFARLYATIDNKFKKSILQDLPNAQVIKVLKLSVEFLTEKVSFNERRVQMEIDGCTSEDSSLNHKFDQVLWTNGTEAQKDYFSDWTIVLKNLESEGNIRTFHVHRVCFATGKYKSEYFLTLWTMQGNLKEHETCTSRISMSDDMIDSFPFLLDNIYGESIEKCVTLNSKYRYGAVTVLALARYFYVEQLVKDMESYIENTCAKRIYDEELCKQVDFWVYAAKIYGETRILDCANKFCQRANHTLGSICIHDVSEVVEKSGEGVEISANYLHKNLKKMNTDQAVKVDNRGRFFSWGECCTNYTTCWKNSICCECYVLCTDSDG